MVWLSFADPESSELMMGPIPSWYENERKALELRHAKGRIDDAELERALADLERRYEEMLDRLDGTYRIPDCGQPRDSKMRSRISSTVPRPWIRTYLGPPGSPASAHSR